MVFLTVVAAMLPASALPGTGRPTLRELEQAVAAEPQNPQARYMLGLKYEIEGRPQLALKEYAQALKLKPDYEEVLLRSGEVKFMQGDAAAGIREMEKAFQLNPQSPRAREALAFMHGRQGLTHLEQGRFQEAAASFETALRYRPQDDGALNNLGVVLSQMGRLREAREAFQAAAQADPNNPQAQFNLGVAYLLEGNKEGALQQYAILGLTRPQEAAELFALISFPDRSGMDLSYGKFRSAVPDRYPESFRTPPTPDYPSPLQTAPGLDTTGRYPGRLPGSQLR
jgi:Flp pilus assembly protein TadD